MINYIKHEEQFYGTVKLSNGEEIIGEIIATKDVDAPEEQTIIFISNPAVVRETHIERDGGVGVGVGLTSWQNFSDEDFFILPESQIVTIAPLSTEGIMMYESWVKQEEMKEMMETEYEETPVDEKMGKIGSVKDARKLLEKIFKKS